MRAPHFRFFPLLLVGFLLFSTPLPSVFLGLGQIATEEEALEFTYSFLIMYENNGTETWHLSELDVAVGLFFNTSWQSVELIWTNWPIERVVEDRDGNKWAILAVPDMELEPGESLNISARYKMISAPRECPNISIGSSGHLSDIPADLKNDFTGPGACWLTEDEELRELALNLSAGKTNVLEIIASFVEWISDNVKYASFEIPRYPNETYNDGLGDCDDQANLFITLCRIVGIPAYLQIGCIYAPMSFYYSEMIWKGHITVDVKSVGWHGWAMAYIPPWGWLPVDLTIGDVKADPLNAIRGAARWHQYTFWAMDIRESDYVGGTRAMRAFVIENDIYIYQKEEMVLVGKAPFEEPDMTMAYVLITSVCITTAACLIALALYITRQKAPYQPKGITEPGISHTNRSRA